MGTLVGWRKEKNDWLAAYTPPTPPTQLYLSSAGKRRKGFSPFFILFLFLFASAVFFCLFIYSDMRGRLTVAQQNGGADAGFLVSGVAVYVPTALLHDSPSFFFSFSPLSAQITPL